MNVVCPTCSTKYSVPDAKVAGKRARMKCKRCGAAIAIDGTGLTASPRGAAPTAHASSPEAPPQVRSGAQRLLQSLAGEATARAVHPASVWTLVQPSGKKDTLTTDQLIALYRDRRVEPGALVWKEGMANWVPPYDVPEITAELTRCGVALPGAAWETSTDDDRRLNEDTSFSDETVALGQAESDALKRDSLSRSDAASEPPSAPDPSGGPGFFDDEEVTRAMDSLDLALGGAPETATGRVTPPAPGVRPSPRPPLPASTQPGPVAHLHAPSHPTAPHPSTTPRMPPSSPASFDDEDEATRMIDSSAHATSFDDEDVATHMIDSPHPGPAIAAHRAPARQVVVDTWGPRHAGDLPSPAPQRAPTGEPRGSGGVSEATGSPAAVAFRREAPERLDESFLGSTEAPPEEAPASLGSGSILSSAPPPSAAALANAVALAPEATVLTQRPAGVRKKHRGLGFFVFVLLLAAAGAALYLLRPDWVEMGRHYILSRVATSTVAPAQAAPGPEFDRQAAGVALAEAASLASRCKEAQGPTGPGRVHVRYEPAGSAVSAELSEPFAGTRVGRCLSDLFASTKVPPFGGQQVIVAKNFTVD